MINNTAEDSVLGSVVAKAISVANTNPFDKKICSNCKQCNAKGDIKNYCGTWRKQVSESGSCDNFTVKLNQK